MPKSKGKKFDYFPFPVKKVMSLNFNKLYLFLSKSISNRLIKNIKSNQKLYDLLNKTKQKFKEFNSRKISYSQVGEDRIVQFILNSLKISSIQYLEVGSYHPKYINNTYLFYKNGCTGVCVEPDPYLFNKIRKTRHKDICLNIGIGIENNTEANFYIMKNKSLNTFSKYEADELSKTKQKIEKILTIPVFTINYIIENYFTNSYPNFISIDVEGLDFEILKSFDFNKYKTEIFCIETINYTENNTEIKNYEIISYMKQKGYMVFADTYVNTVFVLESIWRNRKTHV